MMRQRFISVYRSHSDESGARTADDGKVEILLESVLSLRNLHLDSINPTGVQLNGRVYLGFCQISVQVEQFSVNFQTKKGRAEYSLHTKLLFNRYLSSEQCQR